MPLVRVAAAQFFSGTDPVANLALCDGYVRRAAAEGARLVVLPENANRVRDHAGRDECWRRSEDLDGPFVSGLRATAAELGVHIAVGVDLRGAAEPVVHIASVLIGPDGEVIGVHNKHVLWDYEYTLFEPGGEPYRVFDTELGRIGLLLCADGIVPDTPRALGLLGAEILCNSLNSRGPDEFRVHVPLRAMENRVFHIAANTVGGPELEWPWMGGSQIVAPDGTRLADAGETEPGLVVADIDPAQARDKRMPGVGDLFAWRRPELYGLLTAPLHDVPAAAMYGPAPAGMPPRPLPVAVMQVSWFRSGEWTVLRALGQIAHAGASGARLGVLPELFCFAPGEVAADPARAAEVSRGVLARLAAACAEAKVWVAVNLVEEAGGAYHSTVHLIDDAGELAHRYRKTHLTDADRAWASPGDALTVADTPIGRIGFMIGEEVWVPEAARALALGGAEVIVHPTTWTTPDAMHVAATERTEENRVHLVSVNRLDDPAGLGSQVVRADDFVPGQPIAVMRYPTGYWTRPGFEEQLLIELDLRESNDKMMGRHLDPLAKRHPELYGVFTAR
ncbi:carbon-nitrogen hydrolase family protein [Spirillospora sp. NPDC047418]